MIRLDSKDPVPPIYKKESLIIEYVQKCAIGRLLGLLDASSQLYEKEM